MAEFLARRLIGVALVLWASATLTFAALHIIPGDPVAGVLAESNASPDVIRRRREALGLDKPVPEQYASYFARLARGDLGVSWYGGEPVAVAVGRQLPASLSLTSAAMVVALAVGVGLGMVTAAWDRSPLGVAGQAAAGLALATPVMFSATLLIWLFAVRLDVLPGTGQGGLAHLVLPSLALGISASGGVARAVDVGLREAISQPFIRAARAKGLMPGQALIRHGLQVGLLPAINVVALQSGYLLGGAVVTESVFARQGLGRLLVSAVLRKDLPIVQGVVLLSALAYSMLNLLADLTHAWFDPRVRLNDAR
jgi:ABC-type dipeptide/oligopeptide/nickel transport system permease component